MRTFLTGRVRRLDVNWFWALALLALPGCGLSDAGSASYPTSNVNAGPEPHNDVIFCQIEKSRHCANANEITTIGNLTLAAGAAALRVKQSSTKALDYSTTACAPGIPEVVEFYGTFPEGVAVCANCGEEGVTRDTALNVCIQQCDDLKDPGQVPATADTDTYCTLHSKIAINALDPKFCFSADTCSNAHDAFLVERRTPEDVIWTHQVGVSDFGGKNSLARTADDAAGLFDAGADSDQEIDISPAHGDGYVEFTATAPGPTRVLGLRQGPGDLNPEYQPIDFAISLFEDCVYVFEKGTNVGATIPAGRNDCSVPGNLETFGKDDKLRISVKNNFNGTATVSYAKLTGSCTTDIPCVPFYEHTTPTPANLRVDTSFKEKGGEFDNVVLVRIR